MNRRQFERLVSEAMDGIVEPFASALAGVAVIVEEYPPPEDPDLYGLYLGVPLDDPSGMDGQLPPQIAVYMHPLIDDCETLEDLVEEIRITVLHELGHHLGMDEDQLDALGYG